MGVSQKRQNVDSGDEPHLPTVNSLGVFLDTVTIAAAEVEPMMPGLRQEIRNIIEDMSNMGIMFSDVPNHGGQTPHQHGQTPGNPFYLGVCVVCPPWAVEALALALPLLLMQVLPYLGRVRVHLLVPPEAHGAIGWVLANCEFAMRLQLSRLYLAESNMLGPVVWHDAL